MIEGTRLSQLFEAITQLKIENAGLKDPQAWQQTLLEELIQQVGNLTFPPIAHPFPIP